ncbi:ATP-dependent Clp protease proteolytic subunit [Paenibacillus sp. KQZ6P-2]|uniref:ATP-dependent Clp protease proteolytic subunit n=1 Tax=Paenibacillus mangrovi TaxID=2931978 RepID=A0A9X1WM09_9BACL|nr:NfeD family protein [Paenibacillus mangrovi]MCJ8011423.1 ATP-dependent Clp protease proteolytic subunit [Paenibacillus mangrovi]
MWFVLLLLVGWTSAAVPGMANAETAKTGPVYVIPVDQKIETGLEKFMERGFKEAEKMNAGLIVLEINTPGGLVNTAQDIGKMIRESNITTVAYIRGNAASAGSYIALNADKIAMSPGSMIGAAAMVDSTGKRVDDPKLVAAWKSEMTAAAESSGRNGEIAAGMADINAVVDMPEIGEKKEKGEIIALSSEQALKVGYADTIASTPEEVVSWMGYSPGDMFLVQHTGAEKLASFLTNPVVMTILLFLGIAGIVIELIVPGFGVPGIVGVAAFVLYFFGNYVAGFAGKETWLLFIVGLILMILEMFIPSFGILGVLGAISLVAGVVRAAYDTSHAMLSLGIAFAAAAVVVIVVAIIFKERGIWNRFILSESLTKEQGYVPTASKEVLLGREGVSVTPLRPAGTAVIGQERIDVVTDGEFIARDTAIVVVRVEGARVVVKPK